MFSTKYRLIFLVVAQAVASCHAMEQDAPTLSSSQLYAKLLATQGDVNPMDQANNPAFDSYQKISADVGKQYGWYVIKSLFQKKTESEEKVTGNFQELFNIAWSGKYVNGAQIINALGLQGLYKWLLLGEFDKYQLGINTLQLLIDFFNPMHLQVVAYMQNMHSDSGDWRKYDEKNDRPKMDFVGDVEDYAHSYENYYDVVPMGIYKPQGGEMLDMTRYGILNGIFEQLKNIQESDDRNTFFQTIVAYIHNSLQLAVALAENQSVKNNKTPQELYAQLLQIQDSNDPGDVRGVIANISTFVSAMCENALRGGLEYEYVTLLNSKGLMDNFTNYFSPKYLQKIAYDQKIYGKGDAWSFRSEYPDVEPYLTAFTPTDSRGKVVVTTYSFFNGILKQLNSDDVKNDSQGQESIKLITNNLKHAITLAIIHKAAIQKREYGELLLKLLPKIQQQPIAVQPIEQLVVQPMQGPGVNQPFVPATGGGGVGQQKLELPGGGGGKPQGDGFGWKLALGFAATLAAKYAYDKYGKKGFGSGSNARTSMSGPWGSIEQTESGTTMRGPWGSIETTGSGSNTRTTMKGPWGTSERRRPDSTVEVRD